jgi:hypothetical protein
LDHQKLDVLNLGVGGRSWWTGHSIGCRCQPPLTSVSVADGSGFNDTASINGSSVSATTVDSCVTDSCILPYYYIEVIHAGVQAVLAIFGFCVACAVVHAFTEEDDASEPVRGELEYIKMRYRSPARQSFRINKTFDNFTTSRNNTLDWSAPRRRPSNNSRPSPPVSTADHSLPPGLTDIGTGDDVNLIAPLKPPLHMSTADEENEMNCPATSECLTLPTRISS